MNKEERLAKRKLLISKAIEETYRDGSLVFDEIKEAIGSEIDRNIKNIIYQNLGFESRWGSYEIKRDSPLYDNIQKVVKGLIQSITFEPTPLSEVHKKKIQKAFDNAYIGHLTYLAKQKGELQAIEDIEEVFSKLEEI